MTGQLRSLTAFQENLGSVPITCMRQLTTLCCHIQICCPLASMGTRCACGIQTHLKKKTNKNSLALVTCSDSAAC